MDKDRIKGKIKDIGGRVQRQVGEWTDNDEQQAKGAAKQAEGKVQNAVGKVKDAARDTAHDMDNRDEDIDRPRKKRVA